VIAAVYCRKNTKQEDRAEEDKSVAQQEREAVAYIEAQGWTLGPVFKDDGISGAEFEKRPELMRLLDSLKPRPPFRAVVMTDLDRLGREPWETNYILKRILEAGVRIFECKAGGGEVDASSPEAKLMLNFKGYGAEKERTQSGTRTHAKMNDKAENGDPLGGFVYGYATKKEFDPVNVDKHGRPVRLRIWREIVESEAIVVRRIFKRYADGLGTKKIANELNRDGIPPTRARKGRHNSWAATSIREILRRHLYIGRPVWNATQKKNAWGKWAPTKRPTGEHIEAPYQPALRIVSDELWDAVQARITTAKKHALRKPDGRLLGRLPGGEVKYLLTGLGTCEACGQSIAVRNRGANSGRAIVYTCSLHWHRTWKDQNGTTVHACENAGAWVMETLDRELLAAVQEYLTPDAMETVIRKAQRRLQAEASKVDLKALRKELAEATTQAENYTRAIGLADGNLPDLVKLASTATQRRDTLQARLAALEGRQDVKEIIGRWRPSELAWPSGRVSSAATGRAPGRSFRRSWTGSWCSSSPVRKGLW
jgi:DNA invertase Pin-like site-specific DNA recombinase